METTLGGDRLGSGNKQKISFRNYERSTHDLSYKWRSTMSSGTLVPFLVKIGLPGDKFEIDLNCEILTSPTVGPLFGSYKVQLDIFEIPLRLYNAKLHMNKLGVGMDMSKILLPQVDIHVNNTTGRTWTYADNEQINASALFKYLGISGVGRITGTTTPAKRQFNACSFLAYWDIYKNYYANKQEAIGYCIHSDGTAATVAMTPTSATLVNASTAVRTNVLDPAAEAIVGTGDWIEIQYPMTSLKPNWEGIKMTRGGSAKVAKDLFTTGSWFPATHILKLVSPLATLIGNSTRVTNAASPIFGNVETNYIALKSFPLANIDTMKESILQWAAPTKYLVSATSPEPYSLHTLQWGTTPNFKTSIQYSQEQLAIKTYQSDLFNNWINTEWIDGTGGISDLTAVNTATGEFTIDALNIASKVYDMLNRIAISGGTYDDWLDAVYTHERVKGVENPIYCGGLIKELAFEEVISLANTSVDGDTQPLGTLAGRGRMTSKHKGGKVELTVNEPSYIMGIVSLTPRIEYSQGNEWDVNLKTFDDFHKPALDAIGYQDLISEQLLHTDSDLNSATGAVTYKSLGKQPAWINYMTSVDKCYGGFAEPDNAMFMVLNRRYEKNADGTLKDGTTYIDPSKFNNIFAETALDSQNFWVQIAVGLTARRKMSAKVIPNL